MERLWIVEARFDTGWEVCDFGTEKYASTNFHTAHEFKRDQQRYLKKYGSPAWYKNRFRVREYLPAEEQQEETAALRTRIDELIEALKKLQSWHNLSDEEDDAVNTLIEKNRGK